MAMLSFSRRNSIVVLGLAVALGFAWASRADAQRQQFKIESDGTVLQLKRTSVTSFKYVAVAKAQLRQDNQGNAIWYFKAPTGKEYTAPAPDRVPAERLTESQLAAAFIAANAKGTIPTSVKVETRRGQTLFDVKFAKNTLGLRWHAQAGMSARQFETLDRALRRQGYQPLFAEPYTSSERSTRFVAGWRR